MISNYTNAVDYLHTTMALMGAVWRTPKHPEIEQNVEQAFKILTENPFYEGEKPKVN